MREGWEQTTLGNLLTKRGDFTEVQDGTEYRIAGVTRSGGGLVEKESISSGTTKFNKLMKLRTDDFVYRTITAFEAPSTVVPPQFDGYFVTPQTFPVFTIASEASLPSYLRLLTTSPRFHAEMAERCVGSVLRRKTLSVSALRSIPVSLPPLHEQLRIVDLMDSVDAAISAAQAEVDAAIELRVDLFDGLLRQFVDESEVVTLGELGEFIRGRRFTKSDYVENGLGCIHYGQVHTHFGLTAYEPLTFVPSEMKERLRFASTGDVVIAATSEDTDDLGKATVWLGAEDVAVHDDCQIFRHEMDPLFATHLIASHGFHRQKVQYAAGTKVTRISGPNLAKIEVQVPELSRQEEIGRTMVSLGSVVEKAQESLDHLRGLRSSMLTVLLSGEHEIPESYDQFLDLSEVVQAG